MYKIIITAVVSAAFSILSIYSITKEYLLKHVRAFNRSRLFRILRILLKGIRMRKQWGKAASLIFSDIILCRHGLF